HCTNRFAVPNAMERIAWPKWCAAFSPMKQWQSQWTTRTEATLHFPSVKKPWSSGAADSAQYKNANKLADKIGIKGSDQGALGRSAARDRSFATGKKLGAPQGHAGI